MTPPAAELHKLAQNMQAAGADIIKIATMANDITDSAAVLSLLENPAGRQIITLYSSSLTLVSAEIVGARSDQHTGVNASRPVLVSYQQTDRRVSNSSFHP
jgi:hypothetical protein